MNNDGRTEMTAGQKMVGLDFNPSGDTDVTFIKSHIAEIIDLISSKDLGECGTCHVDTAIRALITAQMWAVKALTCKN